ncbi:ATP synthase subunit I [Metallumcola ferriviriculae]|uniref:ATP synthase subunit I n=1 Tax=Metallumcola ferriviriculae TaxID=3039180 RepID=A0AAU0UJ64_9FIRM|nr:ATP synthase subunit I [Desulfitibacteraceae bacterium MK1]
MKSLGQYQQAQLPKIRQIIVMGLVLAGIAVIFGQFSVAMGIAAGVPVSVINYYLMVSAIDSAATAEGETTQTFFMRRFLYRTLITFTTLFLSLLGGVQFMLGMAVGLSLQMLVHLLEGISLIFYKRG